jgi:hypothetical protein
MFIRVFPALVCTLEHAVTDYLVLALHSHGNVVRVPCPGVAGAGEHAEQPNTGCRTGRYRTTLNQTRLSPDFGEVKLTLLF